MAKLVIEGPDDFAEVGKAMVEHLAMLQRTVDRLGGGKAVDYAAVERAIAEGAARKELTDGCRIAETVSNGWRTWLEPWRLPITKILRMP
jgi:hypothetical protein